MSEPRQILRTLLTAACLVALPPAAIRADVVPASPPQEKPSEKPDEQSSRAGAIAGKLMVTVGMSITIDSPLNIQRVYIANGDLAEAVAINPKEVLITGKG